jgi:cytochrome c oxidase cbb3-type subunit 3
MNLRRLVLAITGLASLSLYGCTGAPGRPAPGAIPVDPDEVSDFAALYAQNCAGCHGPDGKGGVAISLSDSVYLSLVDDAILRGAATKGIPKTAMPAFAKSEGGMLTDKQIDVIVRGIRERWSKPDLLRGVNPAPYSSSEAGNPSRGSGVYSTYCSSCHGPTGSGGQKASSIVDGSYLALVSDQYLRTIVIVGRPELGAPDWRGNVPGKPMSPQDVSDVTAWLVSLRPKFPGQPYPPYPKDVKPTGEIR